MRKILLYISIIFLGFVVFSVNNGYKAEAKHALATKSLDTISGDTIGTITIYDNSEVVITYKYGLRRATLYYCEKGEKCDYDIYTSVKMVESSISNPYKNDDEGMATFSYKAKLDTSKEYGLKVDAYFGVSSGYRGNESILGSPSISSVQTLETDNKYAKPTESTDYGDEGINELMEKIKTIVNTIVIPILYAATGLFLIVKGVILGIQIVKSADQPTERAEKVRALKWLVIGVGIAFAASTLVGVITGFFSEKFK